MRASRWSSSMVTSKKLTQSSDPRKLAQRAVFLWPYAIYLAVTWGINIYEMYKLATKILGIEEDLNEACNVVGKLFGLDCDSFFDDVKKWTIIACVFVASLQGTTFICCCIMIYRNYKETGFLFTTWFASSGEVEHRALRMREKHDEKQNKKETKKEARREKRANRRKRKHRHSLTARNVELDEKHLLSRYESRLNASETDSSSDREMEQALPLPPMGRRRRGVNPRRTIRYLRRDEFYV
ncbi:hypothetical protein OIO90_004782 [Microbotryomycetes sp. JL221]|nr:hypothetical protein OIO90_004782 [Microbotryomycetes sp. JL221]